jgi:hypothetical protein
LHGRNGKKRSLQSLVNPVGAGWLRPRLTHYSVLD